MDEVAPMIYDQEMGIDNRNLTPELPDRFNIRQSVPEQPTKSVFDNRYEGGMQKYQYESPDNT